MLACVLVRAWCAASLLVVGSVLYSVSNRSSPDLRHVVETRSPGIGLASQQQGYPAYSSCMHNMQGVEPVVMLRLSPSVM